MYSVFQNRGDREVAEKLTEEMREESNKRLLDRLDDDPEELQDEVEVQRAPTYNPRKKLRPTGVARNRRLASKNRRRKK
ncbi:hypothetical protein [Vibrio phage Va2]|nr:hypothetical protein [Vibrio phage Va2]